jgi:hypothetical protein
MAGASRDGSTRGSARATGGATGRTCCCGRGSGRACGRGSTRGSAFGTSTLGSGRAFSTRGSAQLTVPRFFAGAAVESAFIFVVGGQSTGGPTATMERTVL